MKQPGPFESDDYKEAQHDPRNARVDDEPRDSTPEHAHALEERSPKTYRCGPFPHEKLDAYRVALEMARLAKELAMEIPRGHRHIADHLQRSAGNTVLLLAEGANRRGQALKRQRFIESRGESGEVGAAADLILTLEIGSSVRAAAMKQCAGRVSAMLTRMITRLERPSNS